MAKGKISNKINPAYSGMSFNGTEGVHIHESLTRVPNAQNNPGENLTNSITPDTINKAAKSTGSFAVSE